MTLSYAPRRPRRRRWIFIAIAIGAAYALGAWVFRDWTAIHAYSRLWMLEYRCGHYYVNPAQIGYDEQASDHPKPRSDECEAALVTIGCQCAHPGNLRLTHRRGHQRYSL